MAMSPGEESMGLSRRDLLRRLTGRDTLRKLGRALLEGPGSIAISRKGQGRTMEEAIRALQARRRKRSPKIASDPRPADGGAPAQGHDPVPNRATGARGRTHSGGTDDD
jgi:hypothetical protein